MHDILRRRNGYKFFTKLDASMQCYTFELDEESSELCTITTPFGNYRYLRMPMGCCQSSDVSQQIMESLMNNLEATEVYIDDCDVFHKDWDQHLDDLHKALKKLEDNGFMINPSKCEWGVQKTNFLGHWLTPNGIKPWKKKVDAILKLQAPRTLKEVRSFKGAVISTEIFILNDHTSLLLYMSSQGLAKGIRFVGYQNIKRRLTK